MRHAIGRGASVFGGGSTPAAYGLVAFPSTAEAMACKLQILLKMDRLDLAKKQLQVMKSKHDEEVITELCSVYIDLATGQ